MRHEGSVTALLFLDDSTLLSGGGDGRVIRWDLSSGESAEMCREPSQVSSIDRSPDGSVLAIVSSKSFRKGRITMTFAQGGPRRSWEAERALTSTAFLSGERLVLGGARTLGCWERYQEPAVEEWDDNLLQLALAGSVVVGASYKQVFLFSEEGTSSRAILHPPSEGGSFSALAVSPDGGRVAVLSDVNYGQEYWLLVFDLATKKTVLETTLAREHAPAHCVLTATHVVTAGNSLCAWDLNGQLIGELQVNAPVESLTARGELISTGHSDSTIHVWRASDLLEGSTTSLELGSSRFRHGDVVSALAYTPAGQLFSGSWDRSAVLWSEEGEPLYRFSEATQRVLDVAVSRDGRQGAVHSGEGRVWVLDLESGKSLAEHEAANDTSEGAVCFSPDGSELAFPLGNGVVGLWRWGTGQLRQLELKKRAAWQASVCALAYSSNGTRLAIGQHDCVSLWDPTDHTQVDRVALKGQGPVALAFSPDGETLWAVGTQGITARDTSSGRRRRLSVGDVLTNHCLAASPDGRWLAGGGTIHEEGGFTHIVPVWDAQRGKLALTFGGHDSKVSALAFNPAGTKLASGAWDCTIRFWRLGSVEPREAEATARVAEGLEALRSCGWLESLPPAALETLSERLKASLASEQPNLREALYAVFLDLECIESEEDYSGLVQDFADSSDGILHVDEVQEDWDTKEVRLSFGSAGRRYDSRLVQLSDWADLAFVAALNQALADQDSCRRFVEVPGDFGQCAAYFFAPPLAVKKAHKSGLLGTRWPQRES